MVLLLAVLAVTGIFAQAQTMFVDTTSSIYEYNGGVLSGTFATGSTVATITALGFDDDGDLFGTASGHLLEFVNTDGVLSSTPIVTALAGAASLAFQPDAVPKPSTMALGLLGVIALGGIARRKRRTLP